MKNFFNNRAVIKNKNLFTNRKLIINLFFTYFFILLMPMIILTGILYKTSVIDLQKEIEKSNLQKLVQIQDSLDVRMKEINHMAFKMNTDVSLSPSTMRGNEYLKSEAIKKIAFYKSNSSFIEDFYIYYKETDNVFSHSGIDDLSTLTRYVYSFSSDREKKFINDIKEVKTTTIRASEKVRLDQANTVELVTYLYPLSHGGGQPYGTIIFLIKKSVFESMINNLIGDLPESIFILDKNREAIVSINSKNNSIENKEALQLINRYYNPGLYKSTLNGKNYSLIEVKSNETGWTFASLIQTSNLYKSADYMKTLILEIVFSILVFGLFIIYVFVRKNYKPINRIVNFINQQWSQKANDEKMDEIGRINEVVVSAINQNKELKARMDFQKPLIKEQILARIIKGEIDNYNEIMDLAGFSELNLSGPAFNVMVITNNTGNDEPLALHEYTEKMYYIVEKYFMNIHALYPIHGMESNAIVLIINLESRNNLREYQRTLAMNIKQTVEELIGGEIIIGAGIECDSVEKLNKAYIEALAALDANMIKLTKKINFFDEVIINKQQIYWYPSEEQIRFAQSLKIGNKAVAVDAIAAMIKKIEEKEVPILTVKYICFDVVNIVVKTMNELNITGHENDIKKLMEFTSLENLKKSLIRITEKVCSEMDCKKQYEEDKEFEQILNYINKAFDNYNLTLEGVAQEFGLSISYMSRLFKENAGCTFTDYVSRLRMEKAKELLIKTEKPMKDIIEDIGYTDISSFMRKFKNIEGITPGQYRKMYSINSN